MNSRRLLDRIEKIESLLSSRGATSEPAIDVSETIAIIASLRPDMIRLSQIDQKRWYCPDDPRSVWAPGEIDEEAKIKARVLERCTALGFPEGYGQRRYRKDHHRLINLAEKEQSPNFIRFTAAEQAEILLIRARMEGLYEIGPAHRAGLRAEEIKGDDPLWALKVTVWEYHQLHHLEVLHPDEPLDDEELASLDRETRIMNEFSERANRISEIEPRVVLTPKEKMDDWHLRKGEDPRFFKSLPSWVQFPTDPYLHERQNQQAVAMGFKALPRGPCDPTKEEWDANMPQTRKPCE